MDDADLFVGIILCGIFIGSCIMAIDDSKPDEYYLAYTMNEQYVGDITVNGIEYTDVLIMNVTPQQYAYGMKTLHTKTDIFGNLEVYDSWYLGKTDHPHQLYFAGEHAADKRFPNDMMIVCRWVEVAPEDYAIKGVWGYNEVEFK